MPSSSKTMEKYFFNTEKTIGVLLITGSILLFILYTILSIIFEYPVILRQDTGVILTKFYEGGSPLIWTWWAFAIVGLPLLEAVILMGQKLESKFYFVRWATTLGIIGLVVQMIGLLRWTFVVPILANNYVHGDAMQKVANVAAFQLIHQFGGVILGEHLGQIFTIVWTIMITSALQLMKVIPKWIIYWGYVASGIYLLAQSELFATVIPNFPVVNLAGFIGSTLWLIWLIIVGFKFLKIKL